MDSSDPTLYRDCEPVAERQYQVDGEVTLSEVIIAALAEAAERDPVELEPLYQYADIGVLDALLEDNSGREGNELRFQLAVDSWVVLVRGDGRVQVYERTDAESKRPPSDSDRTATNPAENTQ